jgi:hypothetical protein
VDPRAGTYQELVRAAELCSSRLIHPGDPLHPNEPNLEEWVDRGEAGKSSLPGAPKMTSADTSPGHRAP